MSKKWGIVEWGAIGSVAAAAVVLGEKVAANKHVQAVVSKVKEKVRGVYGGKKEAA